MVDPAAYLADFATILDKWVIIISIMSMAYLLWNFPRFYRKYIVGSYLLALSLFTFWAIRAVFASHPLVNSFPFILASFVMDIIVVTFTAAIVYHFQKGQDFEHVRRLFGLQRVGEAEVIEYGGPELEDIEPGKTYMVLETGHSYQWKLLNELSTDLPAICFTRKHPSKIDIDPEAHSVTIFWLSESGKGSTEHVIEPFRRGEIQEQILSFAKENRNPVILIDSIEYLIYKNSAEAVIEFMQHLNDTLANRRDTIIVYAVEREGLKDDVFALMNEEVDEIRSIDENGELVKKTF